MNFNSANGIIKQEPFDWSQGSNVVNLNSENKLFSGFGSYVGNSVKQEQHDQWSTTSGCVSFPSSYPLVCNEQKEINFNCSAPILWNDGHNWNQVDRIDQKNLSPPADWSSIQHYQQNVCNSTAHWNTFAANNGSNVPNNVMNNYNSYQSYNSNFPNGVATSEVDQKLLGRDSMINMNISASQINCYNNTLNMPHQPFTMNVNMSGSFVCDQTTLESPYFNFPQNNMPDQFHKTLGGVPILSSQRKRKKLTSQVSIVDHQDSISDIIPVRKKPSRFEGLTEDEVMLKTLPDHLTYGLDIVVIGINPGLTAAHVGHHYAGPGNHFWKCLHLSGIITEPLNAYHDANLISQGIGFTNMVGRTTKSSAALSRKEMRDGAEQLKEKIVKYQPRIAVFNGKGIYEIFSSSKNFIIGKQPDVFPGTKSTIVFVMPSSSARCSQLPRAIDKVPFYVALRKLRDFVRGDLAYLSDSEVTFPDLELKVETKDDHSY